MGTANPMPANASWPSGSASATTMPMTMPRPSSSGPPELPGLTAASNWISPLRLPVSVSAVRSSPETTPEDTLSVRPSGLPIATTDAPTSAPPPRVAGTTTCGSLAGVSRAMSVCLFGRGDGRSRHRAVGEGDDDGPDASAMTWSAVRIVPLSATMTPRAETAAGPDGDHGRARPAGRWRARSGSRWRDGLGDWPAPRRLPRCAALASRVASTATVTSRTTMRPLARRRPGGALPGLPDGRVPATLTPAGSRSMASRYER